MTGRALCCGTSTQGALHLTVGRSPRWDYDRRTAVKEQVIEALRPEIMPSEIERPLRDDADRYFRATEPARIVQDLQLTKRLEKDSLAADWQVAEDKHCVELTVCTRDKAGLFAAIAGTLTPTGEHSERRSVHNVRTVSFWTHSRVSQAGSHSPVKADKWARIEEHLKSATEVSTTWVRGQKVLAEYHPSGKAATRSPGTPACREIRLGRLRGKHGCGSESGGPARRLRTRSRAPWPRWNSTSLSPGSPRRRVTLWIFFVTDSRGQKLVADDMPRVELHCWRRCRSEAPLGGGGSIAFR